MGCSREKGGGKREGGEAGLDMAEGYCLRKRRPVRDAWWPEWLKAIEEQGI